MRLNWKKLQREITSSIDVLFIAASATEHNSSVQGEAHRNYHKLILDTLVNLGFNVTSTSELSSMLLLPQQNFIYGIHSHCWFNGKEVFTSVLSEYYGTPYLGPTPTIRAISEDKKLLKLLAKAVGIPVLPHIDIERNCIQSILNSTISTPRILKPRNGIASQHVYYIEDKNKLESIINSLPKNFVENSQLMLEPFFGDINISVPIIEGVDNESLPIFEEHDDNPYNIITFEGKRRIGGRYVSSIYNGPFKEKIKMLTAKLEAEIRPYDYGRLDFRCCSKTGEIALLDANLICNLSRGAVVAKAAKELGASHTQLVEHVLAISIERQKHKLNYLDSSILVVD